MLCMRGGGGRGVVPIIVLHSNKHTQRQVHRLLQLFQNLVYKFNNINSNIPSYVLTTIIVSWRFDTQNIR